METLERVYKYYYYLLYKEDNHEKRQFLWKMALDFILAAGAWNYCQLNDQRYGIAGLSGVISAG